MLVAARFVVRAEWPEGSDGYYYWEHCHWVETDDWDSHIQLYLAVLADMRLIHTSQVGMGGLSLYDPSDASLIYRQNNGFVNVGVQAAQDNPNLLLCARWRMWGADGSYTYHLHRTPIGEDDLEYGRWSAAGLTRQQTRMNTYIAQEVYRTRTGSLIERGEVADKPVMWQLRHGTRRRESTFWLVP